MRRVLLPALLLLLSQLSLAQNTNTTAGNTYIPPVKTGFQIRTGGQALAQAATRRIDIVQLSDSNQYHFNGGNSPPDLQNGWDSGWQFALQQKFGVYATGAIAPAENGGSNLGIRGWMNNFNTGALTFTGAGGNADLYESVGSFPTNLNYQYVASGIASALGVLQPLTGASFTATIAGTTMTVSALSGGIPIAPGSTITSGATTGTVVVAYGPNTVGGVGTYTVSISQTVSSATAMTTRNDGGPWKPANHLRFHYAVGSFSTGTGWYQPYIRREDSGFGTIAQEPGSSFSAWISNGTSGVAGTIMNVTTFTSGRPLSPGMVITSGATICVILNQLTITAANPLGEGGTYTVSVSQATGTSGAPVAMTAMPGTNDGVGGNIIRGFLDMPATTGTAALQLGFRMGTGGTSPVGPFVHFYSRLEDPNQTTGVSCHTIYGLGGMGLWDYGRNLLDNTNDLALQMAFIEARRLQVAQGLTPIIVIIVNSGANDRNYVAAQATSLGPLGLPGTTTITAGSAIIAAANAFSANQPVTFVGSLGAVTGITAGTTYFVSATGLSATQFEVSATLGGAVITPGGSGTATPTIAGNSAPNFVDNLTAIKQRIENLYSRFWPISELSWIIMVTQPVSTPDDANLLAYRAAVKTWVNNYANVSQVDLNALASFTVANAAGWTDTGGAVHLSNLGYNSYAALAINDVITR